MKFNSKLFLSVLIFFSAATFAAESKKTEAAIFAGGCFWGMEEVFRKVPGVVATEVGYSGGSTKDPSYEQVSEGKTGHAESIQVQFDPAKISYEDLVKTFFRLHDPTSLDRQGNDVGTQYRSEIFYMNHKQKEIAKKVIEVVDKSKKWPAPVVTKVEAAQKFYPAEKYHQKYLVKNPNGYSDHYPPVSGKMSLELEKKLGRV